jgi:hypothetical protein
MKMVGRKSENRSLVSLIVGAAIIATFSVPSPSMAHHAPRLFDNRHGDHGGSYDNDGHHSGRHIFFWMPDEKRFEHLRICLWERGDDDRQCERFRVRRVPAASFNPWGVEIVTADHFEVTSGGWNLRFYRGDRALSPRLGFHRG